MLKKTKKQSKKTENEKIVCNFDRKRIILLMWILSEFNKKSN
jgi:ribosomal protein L35